MKTLLIYIASAFFGFTNPEFPSHDFEYSIPIDIIFGRGFFCHVKGGICDVKQREKSTPLSNQLIFDSNGKPKYIEILKHNLTKEDLKNHFSSEVLHIDKPIELSQSKSLTAENTSINSGTFILKEDKYSFRIDITQNSSSKN